jgi:hypothetical protein
MPGFLEDKKDQEKLARDLSEAQFQIEWADHEEQKGNAEKAAAIREKASDKLMHTKELKAAAEAKYAETEMEQFNQNNRNYADNMTKFTTARMANAPGNTKNPLADNALTNITEQIKTNDTLLQSQDPDVLLPELDTTKYNTEQLGKLVADKKSEILKAQATLKKQRDDINRSALSGIESSGGGNQGQSGGQLYEVPGGFKLPPKRAKAFLEYLGGRQNAGT